MLNLTFSKIVALHIILLSGIICPFKIAVKILKKITRPSISAWKNDTAFVKRHIIWDGDGHTYIQVNILKEATKSRLN